MTSKTRSNRRHERARLRCGPKTTTGRLAYETGARRKPSSFFLSAWRRWECVSGYLHCRPGPGRLGRMDIRERLLGAAAQVYAEAGYRGATTRRIAHEAGVSEITLFRQFGSKE